MRLDANLRGLYVIHREGVISRWSAQSLQPGLRIVGLLLLMQLSFAATAQTGNGSIRGIVVRTGTNEPVAGAQVTLNPNGTGGRTAATDAQGKFAFTDLPAVAYALAVTAPGYVKQEYGQRMFSERGTSIDLRTGPSAKDIVMRLMPVGSLSGRVRDTADQPIAGVTILLLRRSYDNDGAKLITVTASARTDDRGDYRIYWITPGRYLVMALGTNTGPLASILRITPVDNANLTPDTYSTLYFPGVVDSDAARTIDVQPGADLAAIDFNLAPQSLYHIRGRVIDARNGQPTAALQMSVTSASGFSFPVNSFNRQTGAFDIGELIPLEYVLNFRSGVGGVSGSVTVRVRDADVNDLVVSLGGSVSLSGRVDTDSPSVTFGAPLRVQLNYSGHGPNSGRYYAAQVVNRDGTFTLQNLGPGEYEAVASPLPQDAYLKELRYGGLDILGKSFTLTNSADALTMLIGYKPAEVEGMVIGRDLQAAANLQVVLIPDRRDRTDLYKTATTNAMGRFRFTGVTPGDYKLFSWDDIEPNSWFDSEVLRQFDSKGKPIHLAESGKETADLSLITIEGPR